MPLYEYKCLKCGRRTEKIESFKGPHLKKCPHCGGKVEALISAPAIQFKGSGWYVTDYAGKSKGSDGSSSEKGSGDSKETASKDSGGGKDSGAKDSGGKDSKSSKETKKEASSAEKKSEKQSNKK